LDQRGSKLLGNVVAEFFKPNAISVLNEQQQNTVVCTGLTVCTHIFFSSAFA